MKNTRITGRIMSVEPAMAKTLAHRILGWIPRLVQQGPMKSFQLLMKVRIL